MSGPIWVGRRSDALFGTPVCIAPGVQLHQLQQLARRLGEDPVASWLVQGQRARHRALQRGETVAEAPPTEAFWFMFEGPASTPVEDGIAVIRVIGSLYRSMWWDDYADIRERIDEAMADQNVRGVLLDIDSPGGRVSGLFELSRYIFSLREAGAKPIWAVANEQATSAAYAIGAACERFINTPSGIVGSIGCRIVHFESSKYDKKNGFTFTDIASGERKTDMSPYKPLSAQGRATLQEMVDAAAEQFFEEVSRYRGLTVEAIRAQEAGIFVGAKAVDANLVDGLGMLDEVLENMRGELASRASGSTMPTTTPSPNAGVPAGGSEMAVQTQPSTPDANPGATTTPAAVPAGATPAAAASTPAAQPAPAQTAAAPAAALTVEAAIALERAAQEERANLITNACEIAGRPDLAGGMIARGMTVGQAMTRLQEIRSGGVSGDGGAINGTPPAGAAGGPTATIDAAGVHRRWGNSEALSKPAARAR